MFTAYVHNHSFLAHLRFNVLYNIKIASYNISLSVSVIHKKKLLKEKSIEARQSKRNGRTMGKSEINLVTGQIRYLGKRWVRQGTLGYNYVLKNKVKQYFVNVV